MSRSKLRHLGIDLPLLPTTSVGSFPKPDYLVKARADFNQGKIRAVDLEEAEKRAIEFWIGKQEELGVDVLVDGEMYRGDMVAYFADQLSGFEQGGLVRSYGNRYYHKPIIVGEVKWKGPITVKWWRYAQGLTSKPVKGIVTGAYTLMDWSFNEFYATRRHVCLALAKEVRKEVEALIRAGCKVIQIDEPAISARPNCRWRSRLCRRQHRTSRRISLLISVMGILQAFIPGCSISPWITSTLKCRTADWTCSGSSGRKLLRRISATASLTYIPTSLKSGARSRNV